MLGGYAHSSDIGGMLDLNLEIQFNLSHYVRAGLGVGYLSGIDGMHRDGNFSNMHGGIMGGTYGGAMGGFSGHNHDLSIVPITFSLYYVLPINPKMDVFMLGGGGYYIASYKDQSTQNESAFGPHIGLGFDSKVANRIAIVAEGLYRFAKLEGLTSVWHEGFREGTEYEHEAGFWHIHHQVDEWHFHEEHAEMQQNLDEAPPFNISLYGISVRVGIKFGF